MSIRTYYHDSPPGVISLPHDSLPPAPSDRMAALGWQFWMLSGDNIESQAAEIAIQAGYTRPTDKFTMSAADTIESTDSESIESKARMAVKLWASKDHYTPTASCVGLIIAGKAHLDMEDPIENKWIRVILTSGVLFHMPQGAHMRVAFEDPDGYLDVLGWTNENVPPSDIDWIKAEDNHDHPVRLNYLDGLGTHR
ncbi:hypothetical protein EV361DRAFT_903255 [Lentinula raphanica]|nr:hypothetical protein F5880DRAFT_79251 [Lentinula raphanica]KAJ3972870.1 hypothetical protein EV361DRAFT_903255 [Lentinula raphanica]